MSLLRFCMQAMCTKLFGLYRCCESGMTVSCAACLSPCRHSCCCRIGHYGFCAQTPTRSQTQPSVLRCELCVLSPSLMTQLLLPLWLPRILCSRVKGSSLPHGYVKVTLAPSQTHCTNQAILKVCSLGVALCCSGLFSCLLP